MYDDDVVGDLIGMIGLGILYLVIQGMIWLWNGVSGWFGWLADKV